MSTVYVLTAINEGKVAECIAIPYGEQNVEFGVRNACSSSVEIGHIPDSIARFLAEKSISIRRTNWMPFKTSWAAPAVNKRYLVKLQNDWVCIATYYSRVGGGYWKDDKGQELADDVVEFWKGLEE
jgi:hypothetical protein